MVKGYSSTATDMCHGRKSSRNSKHLLSRLTLMYVHFPVIPVTSLMTLSSDTNTLPMMDNCKFCQIVAGREKSWKVYETDDAYAFLDINPVNEYHTLVVPKEHAVNIQDVSTDSLLKVMSALKHVVDLYREKLGIEDVQIISCAGEPAQQDVFHFHVHIVPRYKGDGQDVVWQTHPEYRERFDRLIERLH